MNTDSPRVVLRSGSLYFGAWPPSLRERPWRGVHLHGRVRSRGSNGLFSHVECGTHGTHGCSQIFVAAFAERERSVPNAISTREGTRELSFHVSGWFQKLNRVVPCSTVWLCQIGARCWVALVRGRLAAGLVELAVDGPARLVWLTST